MVKGWVRNSRPTSRYFRDEGSRFRRGDGQILCALAATPIHRCVTAAARAICAALLPSQLGGEHPPLTVSPTDRRLRPRWGCPVLEVRVRRSKVLKVRENGVSQRSPKGNKLSVMAHQWQSVFKRAA